MSFDLDLSPTIYRLLRYVEWTLVAIIAFNSAVNGEANAWLGMLFLIAFALLSLVLPIHRPLWQRRGYVTLGLSLVIIAYSLGIDFNIFLYLYIAKSCFLLDRRSIIVIVVVTAIISTPIYVEALPKILQEFSCPLANNPSEIQKFTVNYLGNYLTGNTFAILFSSMVIAEQKSRKRAEALAQQVESLGIALERTRIARDIHDSLGHTLTNLQVQLAVAQEFRQHNLAQSFRAVDLAKGLADQCIEDVSQSLSAMRQPNFNLNQALNSLIEQVRQNQAWQIEWQMNLPDLPLSVSYNLYCIVKEGLINIQKHAQASRICIRGERTPEEIILEIDDNGRGFDLQKSRIGFGLKGIDERVQSLNGRFEIHSQLNQGTQIRIVVPCLSQLR
ncbi:sensor histidine kinase [Nodosilinea sp. FACHB-131]|uniref:sensor histidine kinase n=1 Tax=Cyanophyceae TaxID=3028117 RepID=UPI0016896C66|nr:sensor histidine kinase [Nodosilinea sp. FACHB-131]MBD1876902.1 sensor histidine kinase [Nodosilinea sp. FACHB-131]